MMHGTSGHMEAFTFSEFILDKFDVFVLRLTNNYLIIPAGFHGIWKSITKVVNIYAIFESKDKNYD